MQESGYHRDNKTVLTATVRAQGLRIVVTARITESDPAGKTDIWHKPITEPYTELTFQCEVSDKGSRLVFAAGQALEYLPEHHPLRLIWERWHLNGMRSHCAHQDQTVAWDKVPPCESTGYRCGSAWLVEPLPLEVRRQTVALMTTDVEPA